MSNRLRWIAERSGDCSPLPSFLSTDVSLVPPASVDVSRVVWKEFERNLRIACLAGISRATINTSHDRVTIAIPVLSGNSIEPESGRFQLADHHVVICRSAADWTTIARWRRYYNLGRSSRARR